MEKGVIWLGGINEYIDKETGLTVKAIGGKKVTANGDEFDIVIDYKYEFGTVTDDDIVAPDISEYYVVEN